MTTTRKKGGPSSKPTLSKTDLKRWLANHPQWTLTRLGDTDAISRSFSFSDFAGPLAFAVRLGMLAERRDHHPELTIGWGSAKVALTTHDAKGLTRRDLDLAEAVDALDYGRDAT